MTHGQGKLGRLGEHPGVALEPMGEPQGRVRPERTGSLRGLQGWPDATTLIDRSIFVEERFTETQGKEVPHGWQNSSHRGIIMFITSFLLT